MRGRIFKRCRCRAVGPDGKRRELGAACPDLPKRSHGAWWTRYDVPPGPDGKRRQRLSGPYSSQRDAERALADELTKIYGGGWVEQDRGLTVGGYFDKWLKGKIKLKPATADGYRTHTHIYPSTCGRASAIF